MAVKSPYPPKEQLEKRQTHAPTNVLYDAVIVGGGMGGLTTGAVMTAQGMKVLVLEK